MFGVLERSKFLRIREVTRSWSYHWKTTRCNKSSTCRVVILNERQTLLQVVLLCVSTMFLSSPSCLTCTRFLNSRIFALLFSSRPFFSLPSSKKSYTVNRSSYMYILLETSCLVYKCLCLDMFVSPFVVTKGKRLRRSLSCDVF